PAHSLPGVHEVGSHVTLWQPRDGGHVGFPRGRPPGDVMALPDAVRRWMTAL
ncbi:MAG TPA: alpha/beta hydrolase, partial [Burkholderiaceae bacterium]|nr:alpha/beta hydrolase [Burkholderiaceae bacterium]